MAHLGQREPCVLTQLRLKVLSSGHSFAEKDIRDNWTYCPKSGHSLSGAARPNNLVHALIRCPRPGAQAQSGVCASEFFVGNSQTSVKLVSAFKTMGGQISKEDGRAVMIFSNRMSVDGLKVIAAYAKPGVILLFRGEMKDTQPVSYTHLTLPTICSV